MSSKMNALMAVALFAVMAVGIFAVADVDAESGDATTVTYYNGDTGEIVYIDPVKVGEIYDLKDWSVLNAETPEAKEFSGWYTIGDEDVKTKAGKAVVIGEDGAEFYAEFSIVSYTITIVDGDNVIATATSTPTEADGKITYGTLGAVKVGATTLSKYTLKDKDGFLFAGWDADMTEQVKSDMTVSAIWKAVYKVTWIVDGVVITTTSSADMTAPTTPVKPNYDFNGWSIDGKNVVDLETIAIEGATTLYAVFSPAKLTVSFVNGSEITEVPVLYGYTIGAADVPTAPEGYAWDINLALPILKDMTVSLKEIVIPDEPKEDPVDEPTYYTAVWTIDGQITLGSTEDLTNAPEVPAKEGHYFVGWAVNGVVIDLATYTATEDIVLTAVYAPVKLTVTFEIGDLTATTTVQYGNVIPADAVPVLPEGYVWEYDFAVPVTADLTVVAVALPSEDEPTDVPPVEDDPTDTPGDEGDGTDGDATDGEGDGADVPTEEPKKSNAVLYTAIAVALIIIIVLVVLFIHWLKTKDKL